MSNDCWRWNAAIASTGYGVMNIGPNNKIVAAHRLSILFSGRNIKKGMHTDHLCRIRECVNPKHLEIVTPRTNALRGMAPCMILFRGNKCKQGHEYVKSNTYIRKDTGARMCKICSKTRKIKYSQKKFKEKLELIQCAECSKPGIEWSIRKRVVKFCSSRCSAKSSMRYFLKRRNIKI